MAVYPILFLAVCCQTATKGSRLLIALFAIELGASTFWIGLLIALYGVFPAFLAIYAGRLSDRLGPRLPMALGAFGVGLGLWLPCAFGTLPALFASAAIIGAAFVFFQVSLQNLMGSFGERTDRASNYSLLSLAAAVSSFLAPVLTGIWIDHYGYTTTYGILGTLAAAVCVCLVALPFLPGRREQKKQRGEGQALGDLLRDADLRRTLIVSGVVVTGVHLYSFYFPIYGHQIGFSASRIGVVMGSYAVAAFIVRLVMPAIVRAYSEARVLTHSLWLSGLTFFLFPFFQGLVTLTALSFLLGLGLGCGQPLSILMTFNSSPEGRSGEVLGVRLTANKGIQVAVPVLFGSMGAALGLFPVFWANGALFLLSGRLNAKRPKEPRAPEPVVDG